MVKPQGGSRYVSLEEWSTTHEKDFNRACEAAIATAPVGDRPVGLEGPVPQQPPIAILADDERVWCLSSDNVTRVTEVARDLGLIEGIKNENLVKPSGNGTYISLTRWSQTDTPHFNRACGVARESELTSALGGPGNGVAHDVVPPIAGAVLTLIGGGIGYVVKRKADADAARKASRRAEAERLNQLAEELQENVHVYAGSQEGGTAGREERIAAERSYRRLLNELGRLRRSHPDWLFLTHLQSLLKDKELVGLGEWPTDPQDAKGKAGRIKGLVNESASDVREVAEALEGGIEARETMVNGWR